MGAFLFSLPDDNIAPLSTLTTSGTVSDYPSSMLVDGSPGQPSKLSATTGWWTGDLGVARRIDVVVLLGTNLAPGLANVRFMQHTSDSWGAPAVNVPFVIPARRSDGTLVTPGTPTNPFIDLRGQPGYLVGGYRWWRLNFSTANSANISIGEIVLLSQYRALPYGLTPGAQRAPKRRRVKHETDGGELLGYDIGTTQRWIKGEVMFKDTSKPEIDAWIENSKGDLRPFTIVPNTDVNDAWYVTHLSDEPTQTRVVFGMNRMPLEVMEVGAGIPT